MFNHDKAKMVCHDKFLVIVVLIRNIMGTDYKTFLFVSENGIAYKHLYLFKIMPLTFITQDFKCLHLG